MLRMGLDDQLQIVHCAEISHMARSDSLLTGKFFTWTLNVAIEEPAGIQLCAFTKQTFCWSVCSCTESLGANNICCEKLGELYW